MDPVFRLRPRGPLVIVLLAVALTAAAGLGAAVALREPADVGPRFPPRVAPRPILGAPGVPALALAVPGLAQFDPSPLPSGTGGGPGLPTAPPIGEPAETVRLRGNVAFTVPAPWTVVHRTRDRAVLRDGRGGWLSVRIADAGEGEPAQNLLAADLRDLRAGEVLRHLETGRITSAPPFGDLLGWAGAGYSAVKTDAQGSVSVAGNRFALVRGDGLALLAAVEVAPAAEWPERIEGWTGVFVVAATAFGGAPIG